MKNKVARFQIGKQGLTSGIIDSLNLVLKTHKQVRISVLKSSERDSDKIKRMAEEIKKDLNCETTYRIIGFTIIINRY